MDTAFTIHTMMGVMGNHFTQPIPAKIIIGSPFVMERLREAFGVRTTATAYETLLGLPIFVDPRVGYFGLEVRDQYDAVVYSMLVAERNYVPFS